MYLHQMDTSKMELTNTGQALHLHPSDNVYEKCYEDTPLFEASMHLFEATM